MTRRKLYPHQTPVSTEHLWPLLLHTVRYSMGRQSTAPSTAAELVRCYSSALMLEQRVQIADEIKTEIVRAERHGGYLGADCDHKTWLELVAWLEREVQR
jgi:hypothetical protein